VGPVLVASPPSYLILKLEALADRSKWHKTKDAEDIGTALTWLEVNDSDDWIFDNEFELLVSNSFDLTLTAAELFGRHLAGLLELHEHARLVDKVSELEFSQFASDLRRGIFRGSSANKSEAAAARFGALIRGLRFDITLK
jgi:predicted nucleotidyltransferase